MLNVLVSKDGEFRRFVSSEEVTVCLVMTRCTWNNWSDLLPWTEFSYRREIISAVEEYQKTIVPRSRLNSHPKRIEVFNSIGYVQT